MEQKKLKNFNEQSNKDYQYMNEKNISKKMPTKKGPFYTLVGEKIDFVKKSKIKIDDFIKKNQILKKEDLNIILIEVEITIRELSKLYAKDEISNDKKKQYETWIEDANSRAKRVLSLLEKE